jgi:hypothetical protein
MSDHEHEAERAALLAEHLAARVRAAAENLIDLATALTVHSPPQDGYTPAAVALRPLLTDLINLAVTVDLHIGPGLDAVAAALGVSARTVRNKYPDKAPDLPLMLLDFDAR